MKKIISILSAMILSIGLVGGNVKVALADTQTQITIFHSNDVHGRFLNAFNTANPPVLTTIGAEYIASIKKSVPNSLLIDAGDSTQGLPFATISKGANVIRLMNAAGYDGMVLGNHEFDYGKDALLSNVALASFPVVSANAVQGNTPLLKGINGNNGENFIKTVNGVKVGFFGITTTETMYKTNPSNLGGVTFLDPIVVAQAQVNLLKSQGAKVIIALAHVGNDQSSDPTSEKIASSVNGIDIIIDGHSHTIENKVINNTLIAQTGSYNSNLGKLTIDIAADGKILTSESLITPAAAQTNFTPDPTVKALAKTISDSQKTLFTEVVGRTNTTLWGGTVNGISVGRISETNLGDLVADSMYDAAKMQIKGTVNENKPVIALQNGGGVRDSIIASDITAGQVTTVLPFGNILSLKEVNPQILFSVFENGVSKLAGVDSNGLLTGPDGRFPQIAGVRFEYNPNNAVNSRITKVVLLNEDGTDKTVLDKTDTTTKIVLASNDFEVSGGDGYTMLGALKNIGEGNALDVILANYIKKITAAGNGSFSYPLSQNRSKAVTGFNYVPYRATIIVKNGAGIIADKNVSYTIDNGSTLMTTTNENGEMYIDNLSPSNHAIRVFTKGTMADAYVNNIIGSGTTTKVTVTLMDTPAVAVINAIDKLPQTITLADKADVDAAKKLYDSLASMYKPLADSENANNLYAAQFLISKLSAPTDTNVAPETIDGQAKLVQTGYAVDTSLLIVLGLMMISSGAFIATRKKKTN